MFYIGGYRNRRSLYNIKALSRIETFDKGIRNSRVIIFKGLRFNLIK